MGALQFYTENDGYVVLPSDTYQGFAILRSNFMDPAKASGFLAEYLPKIVDKLTPTGRIDARSDDQQDLAALLSVSEPRRREPTGLTHLHDKPSTPC